MVLGGLMGRRCGYCFDEWTTEAEAAEFLAEQAKRAAEQAQFLFLQFALSLTNLYIRLTSKLSAYALNARHAIDRAPLFDYGPELSEYRHRHR